MNIAVNRFMSALDHFSAAPLWPRPPLRVPDAWDGTQRFADELLVDEGPLHLGRVEEGDTRVYRGRGPDDANPVLAARRLPVGEADPYAPEAECGNLQAAVPKLRFCMSAFFISPSVEPWRPVSSPSDWHGDVSTIHQCSTTT
jgi:hypothetical protein